MKRALSVMSTPWCRDVAISHLSVDSRYHSGKTLAISPRLAASEVQSCCYDLTHTHKPAPQEAIQEKATRLRAEFRQL